MNSIRDHVRAVIGGSKKSGITDKQIDDASWEYYFDLDQTMDHILGSSVAPEAISLFSYRSQRFKQSGTLQRKEKVT
jgi:HBS1 N-terminus